MDPTIPANKKPFPEKLSALHNGIKKSSRLLVKSPW
jgi:hypothetical protein